MSGGEIAILKRTVADLGVHHEQLHREKMEALKAFHEARNTINARTSALQTLIAEMRQAVQLAGLSNGDVSPVYPAKWAETLTSLIGEDER